MSVPVSQAELDQLWSRYRATKNDQDRNAIAKAHAWIIQTILTRHFRENRAENCEDLAQEGWIGLLQAVELFDASRGTEFTTYAFRAVLQTMRRYEAQKIRMVRVSEHRGVTHGLLRRVRDKFVLQYGREPDSDQELAEFLGCNEALIIMVRQSCACEVDALDTPIGNRRLVDFIADPRVTDPAALVLGLSTLEITSDQVVQAMAQLTPKQRQVFQLYVVEGQTLEEIAVATDRTRQAVHQLHQKAIERLRRALGVSQVVKKTAVNAAPLSSDLTISDEPPNGKVTLREFQRLAKACLANPPTDR